MNIDASVIVAQALKNERGRKTGEIQATFLDADQRELLSSTGATKEEAVAALISKLRNTVKALDGLGPSILVFRSTTLLVYPKWEGQWWYGFQREGAIKGETGSWDTREEAERAARRHLAWREWDGDEETSPIIVNTEDQAQFTKRAREDKRYNVLREQGWTDNEAHYLVGGMGRLIPTARFAEMPELPEGITI